MADKEGNPLLEALPPATDYVNYLVLLEHNLNKSLLPTLHTVLQDTKLTENIGWDLVPLLLPLLPESHQCMLDVARLGNPREVVIKVAEGLSAIGKEDVEENDDLEEQTKKESAELQTQSEDSPLRKGVSHIVAEKEDGNGTSPSPLLSYTTFVEMLGLLHPRISTKFPSRFLSTSLQAVLPAYAQVARDPAATEVTLDLIKALSGPSRPKLPPRKSSSHIQLATLALEPSVAPDPEGIDEALGAEEIALQRRLVQSFLTWVVEGFVSSLPLYDDLPGLAWSSRSYEKMHPEKAVPGRQTFTEMFAEEEEELHLRDSLLGKCLVSKVPDAADRVS